MKIPVIPPQSEIHIWFKEFACIGLFFAGVIALLVLTGCGSLTQPQPVAGTTNTVQVVNTNQLNIDAAGVQVIAQSSATAALLLPQTTAPARQVLTDINIVLEGVISGATTNSPSEVAALITSKASEDAQIAEALAPVISYLSSIEQTALAKYGTANWLIISKAFAKAISTGNTLALALVPAKS